MSFCPERPELTGGWKVSIATDLSRHLHSAFCFWKCDIVSGCSSIHVVRANGLGTPSFWSAPHSPVPLWLGSSRATEPSRSPSSAEVRWTARAGCWGLSCVKEQDVPCSLDTLRLAPTSKGFLFLLIHKAILLLSEIWLDIYIHKHIYQHLYLYSAATTLGILQPQHPPLSTSFG